MLVGGLWVAAGGRGVCVASSSLGTHSKDLRFEVCVRRSPTFFGRGTFSVTCFFMAVRVWRGSRVGGGVEMFIFGFIIFSYRVSQK